MTKLLPIIRHEYLKRVRSAGFVFTTVLGPLLLAAILIVPVLLAFIQPAAPRVAVLDQSGELYERFRAAIEEHKGWTIEHSSTADNAELRNVPAAQGSSLPIATQAAYFKLEEVKSSGSAEETKRELTARVLAGSLDAFVIIPPDVLANGRVEYFGRSSGDPISNEQFDDYLSRAIIERRLAREGISPGRLSELTGKVHTNRLQLTDRGEQRNTGAAFFQIIGVGLLLFITLTSYGSMMLSAVAQEKESRLAEILFSSVRSFTLLLGKLIGVSLVAFTQYAIWFTAFGLFTIYGASAVAASGAGFELLKLPLSVFIYVMAFFLVGYFIFATMYAVVGAMMTSQDDSSSIALLTTVPLFIAFSMSMPVMRSPNSWMATLASFVPFVSPILMPIRIVAQTPPSWQILLSLLIGVVTILLLLRLAATVYHTGMLMYGKKVSISEVIRWARHS